MEELERRVRQLEREQTRTNERLEDLEVLVPVVNELEIARRVSAAVTGEMRSQGAAALTRREKWIGAAGIFVTGASSVVAMLHNVGVFR